jgi:uncharacterized membrane protein YczE
VLRRLFLPLPSDRLPERFARCIGGLAMFGLGISLFIAAHLGVAPWDVFHIGLSNHTGIPTGIVIEITGVFVLLLWIPLRQRMGWGTLMNAVEIGLVVFLLEPVLPEPDQLAVRAAFMVAGLFSIGIGSAVYIGSGLGAGPRDGLMMGLAQRGISVRVARTGIEITVLVVGWSLGGDVNVGTALFTFGIGPVVHHFLPRLRMHDGRTDLAAAH